LRAASLSGVRWVSLSRLLAELLSVVSAIVLARLVPPAEFGHAAVALGFTAIALGVAWVGFGTPLIQMKSIDRGDVEVATFLSVVTGAVLSVVALFVLSPYLIDPVFGVRIAYLFKIASPIFLLSGASTVPNAMLQRRLDFRRISLIEIVSLAAGPVAAIGVAAFAGLDGEAVVLGALTTAIVGTVYTLLAAPLAVPRWRRSEARRVAGFGAFAALASVTGTLYNNVDYAILGARLRPQEVGFYWRAYQLGIEYQSKVSGIMFRLALPLYSRADGHAEMRRLRGKMVRIHTIVLYPVLTTLIALAPEVVPLLFGAQWERSVFPTQILAVAGMGAVASVGTSSLMIAAGKPHVLFRFFLVLLAGYVVVVAVASGFGLHTVVVAVAVYQLILLAAQFHFLEHRQVGIPLREIWTALLPGLVGSAISLAIAYPLARLLGSSGVPDVAVILGVGPVAVLVYVVALRLLFLEAWRELIELARAVMRRRAAAGEETPRPVAADGE
jgi:O-antigen/teichoic acid export membrane protein